MKNILFIISLLLISNISFSQEKNYTVPDSLQIEGYLCLGKIVIIEKSKVKHLTDENKPDKRYTIYHTSSGVTFYSKEEIQGDGGIFYSSLLNTAYITDSYIYYKTNKSIKEIIETSDNIRGYFPGNILFYSPSGREILIKR